MSFTCSPDVLIEHIFEELAFDSAQGVPIDAIWGYTKAKIGEVDDFQKRIIWNWLCDEGEDKLLVFNGTKQIPLAPLEELLATNLNLTFCTSDELQWKYLTNLPRNTIGNAAFLVLCAVAKQRQNGIAAMDVTKITGQDPRSLTGRLKALEDHGLVQKHPIFVNNRSTNLLVHHKFAGTPRVVYSASDTGQMPSPCELRASILTALRAAPNRLREKFDLRKQLGLGTTGSAKKYYRRAVAYLDGGGYLKHVNVHTSDDRDLLCIEFVKDLDVADDNSSDSEEQEEEEEEESGVAPMYNRFYPVQNQAFEVIKNSGSDGATTMHLVSSVTGLGYTKAFQKFIEPYITASAGQKKHLTNYSIIRGYDFEGKVKFYRYFSEPVYNELMGADVDPTSGELGSWNGKKALGKFSAVSKKALKPLAKMVALFPGSQPPKVRVDAEYDAPVRKRGRPRKDEGRGSKKVKTDLAAQLDQIAGVEGDEVKTESASVLNGGAETAGSKVTGTDTASMAEWEADAMAGAVIGTAVGTVTETLTDSTTQTSSDAATEIAADSITGPASSSATPLASPAGASSPARSNGRTSCPSGIPIPSFKAIRRQGILLSLITAQDGALVVTKDMFEEIDQRLGSKNNVTDKRTLARDIAILVSQGKLTVSNYSFNHTGECEISRKLLLMPSLRPTNGAIQRAKERALKLYLKRFQFKKPDMSTLNTDISFFAPETTLKAKRAKAAPRVRKPKRAAAPAPHPLDAATADRRPKKAPSKRKPVEKTPRVRKRVSMAFDKDDAMTLYRAVIISRSMSPSGLIEWEKIAGLFQGLDADDLRRKWPKIRGLLGGNPGTKRATETWEKILFEGISEGLISHSDLQSGDYEILIHLWANSDSSRLDDQTHPLYQSRIENATQYEFFEATPIEALNDEFYGTNSIVQREKALGNIAFTVPMASKAAVTPDRARMDGLRTVLKAIFATQDAVFESARVRTILEKYTDAEVKEAVKELERDKEAVFLAPDSTKKFSLTDRVLSSDARVTEGFLKAVSQFRYLAESITEENKALVLSPAVSDPAMVLLLEALIYKRLDFTRVDQRHKTLLEGYESRSLEREKIECDFIVSAAKAPVGATLAPQPVPTGGPCSRIWVDTNGNINAPVWSKIVATVLSHVMVKPGITVAGVHKLMWHMVSKDEAVEVVRWLAAIGAVHVGEYGGHVLVPGWYTVFGYE